MTPAALDVRGLTVTYPGGFQALTDVTFTVPAGGRTGLVGASGSGKTTVVRAVLGLLPHGTTVQGTISVAGQDLTRLGARDRRATRGNLVGYVAQDPYAACDPVRRVRHHIEEAWTAHGTRPPPGAVVTGLTDAGITDAARRSHQYPHQWSGGMLQRATTLAAVAHGPTLTLADEPTSALDTELADETLELLRRECRSLLLVSHDLALVSRHTQDLVVLDGGEVVERGRSGAVLSAPTHRVTAALVGAAAPEALTRPAVDRGAPGVASRAAVRLEGVSKTYGRPGAHPPAVADLDLTLHAGEVVGVVGRSGSGKSTLLRLASGQERPDAGQVVLDGTAAWSGSGARPRLPRPGWVMPVFQDPVASLDRRWPLWRTITEPLTVGGTRLGRAQRRQRARAALDRVGLAHVDVDRLPGSLSVGQCQRVAVVRALIARPALVVADEPTASLDVEAAATVAALLRAAADDGAAVLVVSHDRVRLASYVDRLVTLRQDAGAAEPAAASERGGVST